MIFFNYVKCMSEKTKVKVKFCVMLLMALVTPVIATITKFIEAKFIGIIFFGYACNQVWKVENPADEEYRKPEH